MANEKKVAVEEPKKNWFFRSIDKIKWFFGELIAMYSGK